MAEAQERPLASSNLGDGPRFLVEVTAGGSCIGGQREEQQRRRRPHLGTRDRVPSVAQFQPLQINVGLQTEWKLLSMLSLKPNSSKKKHWLAKRFASAEREQQKQNIIGGNRKFAIRRKSRLSVIAGRLGGKQTMQNANRRQGISSYTLCMHICP